MKKRTLIIAGVVAAGGAAVISRRRRKSRTPLPSEGPDIPDSAIETEEVVVAEIEPETNQQPRQAPYL
jgi:LPXTG-motif cell wall-anchored protein